MGHIAVLQLRGNAKKNPQTQEEFKGEEVGAVNTTEHPSFHVCSPLLENTYIQLKVLFTCSNCGLFTRARAFCQWQSMAHGPHSCSSATWQRQEKPPNSGGVQPSYHASLSGLQREKVRQALWIADLAGALNWSWVSSCKPSSRYCLAVAK